MNHTQVLVGGIFVTPCLPFFAGWSLEVVLVLVFVLWGWLFIKGYFQLSELVGQISEAGEGSWGLMSCWLCFCHRLKLIEGHKSIGVCTLNKNAKWTNLFYYAVYMETYIRFYLCVIIFHQHRLWKYLFTPGGYVDLKQCLLEVQTSFVYFKKDQQSACKVISNKKTWNDEFMHILKKYCAYMGRKWSIFFRPMTADNMAQFSSWWSGLRL